MAVLRLKMKINMHITDWILFLKVWLNLKTEGIK